MASILIIAGCAGEIPTGPSITGNRTVTQSLTDGNRMLWGLWQFQVDLINQTMEVVPVRGGTAHINVVGMLEPVALKFLRIDESTLVIDMDEGRIDVDVILEHPLPMYPEYTGFDVRGILIADGSEEVGFLGETLVRPGVNDTRILNADGYTRWWNPREFQGQGILGYQDGKIGRPDSLISYSGTLNSYKYFADGLGAGNVVMNPLVLQGRGRFSVSSTNRRTYSLQFGPDPEDFMVFNYAVDTCWERPDNMPPTSLDDFPASANALEPFNIVVSEVVNSLYYDPDLIDCPTSGGVLRLEIEVATWQGEGGIDNVYVCSEDLGIDFFEATEIESMDEYAAHIVTYTADLVPTSFSTYEPQVVVAATSPLGSYTSGPEGFSISFGGADDAPLALYQVFVPTTGINSPPIVGPITGYTEVVAGDTYTYDIENYYDCQDMNEDLSFAWEIGDDVPALYNDGMGYTDGAHPLGNGTIDIAFPDEGTYIVDVQVRDMDGKAGYTEQTLEVHATLPPLPSFPPGEINLVLSLKRTIYHSFEFTNNPSDIPAIELTWDGSAVGGVSGEWVIYRDNSPYDGIESWQEIGTSPPGIMFYANLLTGEFGYDTGGAYYYKVKARSVPGNPASESTGSTEWAFIELENAEPEGSSQDLHAWSMGYGGYESAFYMQWETPGYGGAISGGCWMMDPDSDYMRRHQWSVIASAEIPILTDPVLAQTTEEWYIELIFGGQVIPMNECWDNYARLSVGTVPDNPVDHNMQSKYTTYEESHPSNYMAGSAYYTAGYWYHVNSRFDESTGTYNDRYGWGKDEFGWPFNWARYRLTDLDPNGTGRTRAAIGFGSGATTDYRARPRADEIAVIVY